MLYWWPVIFQLLFFILHIFKESQVAKKRVVGNSTAEPDFKFSSFVMIITFCCPSPIYLSEKGSKEKKMLISTLEKQFYGFQSIIFFFFIGNYMCTQYVLSTCITLHFALTRGGGTIWARAHWHFKAYFLYKFLGGFQNFTII